MLVDEHTLLMPQQGVHAIAQSHACIISQATVQLHDDCVISCDSCAHATRHATYTPDMCCPQPECATEHAQACCSASAAATAAAAISSSLPPLVPAVAASTAACCTASLAPASTRALHASASAANCRTALSHAARTSVGEPLGAIAATAA
jgi:hypothetical protein